MSQPAPQIIAPLRFRNSFVAATLRSLRLWSEAAEVLVTGTALQESGLRHVRQIGGGPALGLASFAAPYVGKWLFGDDGEKIAKQVIDKAQKITGASSPQDAEAALRANPELLAQFQAHLADLDADLEKRDPQDGPARRLRQQGRTIDEILAALRGLDVEVSRSAVGRRVQTLDRLGERLRRSRDVAESLTARFGAAPESRTARLNIEIMHSIVSDLLAAADDGEGVAIDPKAVGVFSKALKDLAGAAHLDADRTVKARQEAARQAKEEAAEGAIAAGRQAGMTEDMVAAIRVGIFGVEQ